MSKKSIRNVIIAVGAANLIFCIWFIFAHINSDVPISSEIPQNINAIPFIPGDEKLNDVAEVIDEVKPAILEGKTEQDIKKTLEAEPIKLAKIDNLPSLVDVVKKEKVLSCNEFVKIENNAEQDKIYRLEDC